MSEERIHDIIILGAGPAGLTAAVYAARKQLDVVLVSQDIGGQTNWTQDIENYMGFQYISGAELSAKFNEQVAQFPITSMIGRVATAVAREDELFRVTLSGEEQVVSRCAIVATGKFSRMLNVPGEQEFRGRGVSYCTTCDGPFFRNLRVAIIGGGNSGITGVVDLIPIASEITVVEVTDTWRADPVLMARAQASDKVHWMPGHRVVRIEGDQEVTTLVVQPTGGGEEVAVPVEGVFVEIGLAPNTAFLGDLVTLNQHREIIVDARCTTSVPGLFAAGDVTDTPEKQIIVAAGEGAKAALSAYQYLLGVPDLSSIKTW